MKKRGSIYHELKGQGKVYSGIRALERELSEAQDNLARARTQQERTPGAGADKAVRDYAIQVGNIQSALQDTRRSQKSKAFYLAIGTDHHTDDEVHLFRTFGEAAVWCEGFKLGLTLEHALRPEDWSESDLTPGYEQDWQLRITHDLGYGVAVRRLVVERK